jgi:alanyl-tRNA synthetase
LFLHHGVVTRGRIREGDRLRARVDPRLRFGVARNHTATHLLHAVLREVLGPHVKQYGSLVAPNRLRFDFAHFAPVRPGQLEEVEAIVNERIRADAPVLTKIMGISEAMQEGALAFFGDKYGEEVRVVEINAFSKELCGGTHCRHTGEIGLFKLVSEGEAQTGEEAYELLKQRETELRALADILKTNPADVVTKARKLVTALKEKEEELEKLKARLASGQTGGGTPYTVVEVPGAPNVYWQQVDGLEIKDLRSLVDMLREKHKSGIFVLGSVKDAKATLMVASTTSAFPANELIKPAAAEIGGSGGGRPEMAQAGGKVIERLQAAFDRVVEEVKRKAGA